LKKIKNPYDSLPGYNCFGCSSTNPFGLRMEFTEEGEYIVSRWEVGINFQGYFNMLHGGIQATLMDEIASWVVLKKMKTSGVTAKLDVRYKHAVVAEGVLTIKAKLRETKRNLATIDIELFDKDGKLCASAEAVYFTFPRKVAQEKWGFPSDENLDF